MLDQVCQVQIVDSHVLNHVLLLVMIHELVMVHIHLQVCENLTVHKLECHLMGRVDQKVQRDLMEVQGWTEDEGLIKDQD